LIGFLRKQEVRVAMRLLKWKYEKDDLPQLFRIYLRYGAKVCGPPAIDRFFKTIDYLVVLDVDELDPDTHATFFKK